VDKFIHRGILGFIEIFNYAGILYGGIVGATLSPDNLVEIDGLSISSISLIF
jgi:hypothetical protein